MNYKLWDYFKNDCPIISRIPAINYWAFGHYAYAYLETKQKNAALFTNNN